MNLRIDTREHEFIKILEEKLTAYPHIKMEIVQLPIGDMEIHYNDTLLYIWERKTLQDLLSSVKDGRYAEQSYRLQNTHESTKIVYLIEGIMSQLSVPDKKVVVSALTTLSFYKNFHIWRTVTTHDSVDTFLLICDKLSRKEQQPNTDTCTPTTNAYTDVVKKVKKDNITPENIGEIFLCQIPDINSTSAKVIMKHVEGNLSLLISKIKENPAEFYDLKVGKDKPRKISKRIVERLVTFLS